MCWAPVGLIAGCPLASENAGEKFSAIGPYFAGAGWVVRCSSAVNAVLVAPERFENFPGVHWLAVMCEGAGAPGVVCAGNHGLISFS
jgi:hypothetical protein